MQNKGITGSTLKIIAIITMLIDHIGGVVCMRMMLDRGFKELIDAEETVIQEWVSANANLYGTYYMCRMIGRIAFPIFAFLLVEGFLHTRDVKKYAIRLLSFALISEIPFDLAFHSKVLEFSYQNVFFTLGIGFVTLIGYKWVTEKQIQNKVTKMLLQILVLMLGMLSAQFLRTDYGSMGVFVIAGLYIFREARLLQIAVIGLLAVMQNFAALFAALPIMIYNNKRGWNVKWLFYIFYPAHLLVLYAICYFMGIAGYSAL